MQANTVAPFAPLRSAITNLSAASKRTMATATSTNGSSMASNLNITKRPWASRGHADHGWLYTFHTFNFASYSSPQPKHESFGPLRVINEDRVAPAKGFGTHSHAEFLIWSYIVSGKLTHKDSLGNVETLKRGDVQFTSAGTGIRHSEYNGDGKDGEEVHFLQIWAKPDKKRLTPNYATQTFSDEEKKDRLVRILESTERVKGESGPIPLHADLSMDASILSPGKSVEHQLVAEGERKIYVHVVMSGRQQPADGGSKIKVGDTILGEGDGAYIEGAKGAGKVVVENVGERPAEFLLFDLGLEEA